MKKTIAYIVLLLASTAFVSCETMTDTKGSVMGAKDRFIGEKGQTYQEIDPASLHPVGRLAIAAFQMEKLGLLESFPYAKVNPQGRKLENKTNYTSFTQRNVVIMDFHEEPEGTYAQSMLSEAVDHFGRIDLSNERIVYAVRDPNDQEATAMAESILDVSKTLKRKDRESQENLRKALIEYQRANGLAPDGVMGRKTAESLSQKISILDVKEMASEVVYPQKPRNALYVVPYEVVEQAPDKFNKGFESLEAVKKHAVSPDAFEKLGSAKQRFVVFVYFFDRVDPTVPLRISLASTERRWSDDITPKLYAAPEAWPVIIQSFCLDEKIGSTQLYANLFMKYKCIESYRIR